MTDQGPDFPPIFTIERATAPAGVVVLVISGEIDLSTSGRFRSHIEQAVGEGVSLVIADLSDVSFMESTMLRELLRARDDLAAAGARFVIAGAGDPVRRLLDLTGTTGLFSFAETQAEALGST